MLAVDWKNIGNHAGPSSKRIPQWVDSLDKGRAYEIRRNSRSDLLDALICEGQFCAASAPTVDLLLCKVSEAENPERYLVFVAVILCATPVPRLGSASTPPAEVIDVVVKHRDMLLRCLESERATERAAAALLAAVVPSPIAEAARALLLAMGRSDPDPVVRASAIFSWARFGDEEIQEALEASLRDEEDVVAGAAALIALHLSGGKNIASVVASLDRWLTWVPSDSEMDAETDLHWFGFQQTQFFWRQTRSDGLSHTVAALIAVGQDLDVFDEWKQPLLDHAETKTDLVLLDKISEILQLSCGLRGEGMWSNVLEFGQLEVQQQELALRCLDGPVLFNSGTGFPAAGLIRRRWCGKAEPGPMDRMIEYEGASVPLWRGFVLHTLYESRDRILKLSTLAPAEKWEVMVLFYCGFYRPRGHRLLDDRLATALDELGVCPELREIGPPIVDELALYWSRLVAAGISTAWYYPENIAHALIPLCRAGIQLKKSWFCLLPEKFDLGPLGRELIEAMDPEEREEWLWENDPYSSDAIHFVDLYPSARLFQRKLVNIEHYRREEGQVLENSLEVEAAIKKLAETNALARQGLEQAEQELSY